VIWKIISSTTRSRPVPDPASDLMLAGAPVRVTRPARARRLRLAVDTARREVRLTIPPRASLKRAIAWARDHEDWVRRQLDAAPLAVRIAPGAVLPFEGRDVTICWDPAHARTVKLDGDRLLLGGPIEGVEARIVNWLKRRALATLEAETQALARREGLTVSRVGIGDPRGRWGSCAANGVIRYSWRLIMAPVDVRAATVAHEVAHRVHMDHSPAFHARHAQMLGRDPAPARAWLRANGTRLHAVGR